MDRTLGIIYKITSPTGRIYVGQTWNLEKRITSYRRGGCKNQRMIYNSIKKHGFDSHIIDVIDMGRFTQKELDDMEIFWIDKVGSFFPDNKNGMNLTRGGRGNKGKKASAETIKKQRARRHSEETKKLLSEMWRGGKSPNAKPVFDSRMGIYYDSISEAAHARGMNKNSLRGMLSGSFKHNTTGLQYLSECTGHYELILPEIGHNHKVLLFNPNTGVFLYSLREAAQLDGITEACLYYRIKVKLKTALERV